MLFIKHPFMKIFLVALISEYPPPLTPHLNTPSHLPEFSRSNVRLGLVLLLNVGGGFRMDIGTNPSCGGLPLAPLAAPALLLPLDLLDEPAEVEVVTALVLPFATRTRQYSAVVALISSTSTCWPLVTDSSFVPALPTKSDITQVISTLLPACRRTNKPQIMYN